MEINKIYCESNLETMARMPDNFVDLTVTSPPYDGLRTYNGYSFPFEDIANELYRITKEGGVVVWVVGDATVDGSETLTSFKQAIFFNQIGFNVHDTMIYSRQGAFPSNVRYDQHFEYMFVLSKGKPKTFNPIRITKSEKSLGKNYIHNVVTERKKDGTMKNANLNSRLRQQEKQKDNSTLDKNIWKIPAGYMVSSTDKISFNHPATFPEELVKKHIYSWSNENDVIYDPFMGSGTTAKMAHIYKRNWIGSEMSKEYVDLANKRIQPYLDQTTLF